MSPARWRLVSWAGLVVAALLGMVASRGAAQADAVWAVCWALLAALGVSLLLRTWGRRLVGILVVLLAAGLAALASGQGAPLLWAAAVGAGLAGACQALTCHAWPMRATRFTRAAAPGTPQSDLDLWKAQDAGLDPTDGEIGANLTAQATMDASAASKEER